MVLDSEVIGRVQVNPVRRVRVESKGGIGISGVGMYLPRQLALNDDLAQRLGVTPEWIEKRTGIRTRRFAQKNESASEFAFHAARQALDKARVNAEDLDLIMGCTSSRDYIFPPLAVKVQHLLAARYAGAFDITAGAAGF